MQHLQVARLLSAQSLVELAALHAREVPAVDAMRAAREPARARQGHHRADRRHRCDDEAETRGAHQHRGLAELA
eukprot:CAMPEP_0183389480 /NCGR_PEP_ID=MMETSP0370-20130417/4954_1 /TAXON_ID=268820 /ORGANISM="Peridinium aciculiferum, Strain PAER-2" /LENGTH=73 /DNA_ID=CAMNT_0025568741 /DNA_START=119 /DNA_END=336 /DNA_ORIENTATION=-